MKVTPMPESEVARVEQAYQEDLATGRIAPGGEPPEWFREMYTKAMADNPTQRGRVRKFINACERAWKWFICDHINQCVDLEFDNSTEVRICQGCGRVLWVMDDGDRAHNPHKRDRLVI